MAGSILHNIYFENGHATFDQKRTRTADGNMSTVFAFFLFILLLIWIIFLLCRRTINIVLSWILSEIVKSIFPQDNLDIEVDDFGYFCVKGVHVSFNKKPIVTINQILLKFVWDESIFGLKLQSTVSDLILERSIERCNGDDEHSTQRDEDTVEIKGSLTLGINLFSLNRPTELLKIVPETDCPHGSDIKSSDLTSLWLFARNGEALIQKKKKNGKENCDSFYKLSVSEGDALVLYNSKMARLVLLFKNAYVTCSTSVNQATNGSQLQVATSEGLVLMYKFVDGVLTSSHSRLKHTEVSLTPLAVSTLENLVNEYVEQDVEQSLKDKTPQADNEESCQNDTDICEVAFEAENITTNIFSPQKLTHFELKVAVVGLGSPEETTKKWSISVPFELMFFNADTLVKEPVLGSKIKSEGSINPCVLKAEGERTSHKATKWDVSFHQGILVQIKPHYVDMLESFWKTYKASVFKPDKVSPVLLSEELEQYNDVLQMDLVDEKQLDDVKYEVEVTLNTEREIFEISATICEITIEILDAHDQKLLQVAMMSPQLSVCQNLETRSFNFMIATLKCFNCLENIPFFHPTDDIDEGEENIPSLALSVVEELSNDTNKLSFKKFSFGSCNTTVVVEETLIFAVLKDFGLHKKVPQIFFESNEKKSLEKTVSSQTQRFYFDHLELRAVEVILTLLPAIDLPVDLKVIKNNLGIPHQLPPRFENASLNFDAFERNNIQYGSYKYISNDIKKHYLKELGSQSARVLGSMHLLGNISRLKQDIISGFTTLRETGEFITFFRQVTTGVASSYSKFTGSWSDLFGVSYTNRHAQDPQSPRERRHSEPSELSVVTLRHVSGERSGSLQISSRPTRQSKDDSSVLDVVGDSEGIWLNSSILPDVTDQTDALNWDNESGSSDGEGNFRIPLDLIPRNLRKQLKGQEFLRRLKENLADNEHGEVFACCFKIRKNDVETKLNALLSNRKVFFLKGRPTHESLVLCVKYESLYKAQYLFQDQTHYLQLTSKMKGIRTLSIPSRNPGESPLVRCDNMVIGRKVAFKVNELKKAYDHECIHSQLQ